MKERENNRIQKQAGDSSAIHVTKGVIGGHDGMTAPDSPSLFSRRKRKPRFSVEEYVHGVLNGNRTVLAQAITLAESNAAEHMETAQDMMKTLLPHTGRSIRIGITGVPGAGKSTFIEAFGLMLCERGHKVAVLAVDPSSSVTRGSILGDKTRMENLSRHPHAYIRPSASGGTLGGVARKTRETMLICEAAGYDVILIETVGVGQSEVTVRSMVDFFMLIQITGAGDELQGIKKGVIELADAIIVNKADGDNKQRALTARAEFNRVLHFLKPATEGWTTEALACSALTGEGLEEIWSLIENFKRKTKESAIFEARRQKQNLEWMYTMVRDYLESSFFSHPGVQGQTPSIEQAVTEGKLSVTLAAQKLIKIYESEKKNENH